MKRSRKVEIALVAGLAMAGCGRRTYDPCAPEMFNPQACQDAIANNGYYSGGRWYPHTYIGGYPYFYNSYNSYVQRGGSVTNVPASQWTRPAGAPATGDPASVGRGVFGSSAHGASGGGE